MYKRQGSIECTDDLKDTNNVIKFRGYFQNEKNIRPFKDEVIKLFDYSNAQSAQGAQSSDYFLHIRRGDYVGNSYHELNLDNYYKKSLELINSASSGLVCNVLSNDIKWCEDYDLLKDYRMNFIHNPNEIDGLAIMKNARLGGISANSTYSWWGLYLDIERQHLIIPNRYFPHAVKNEQYAFPECTIIDV